MSDAPLMLGVSGLRGIVGESLTPELCVRYAAAIASWLQEKIGRQAFVLVGRDGRAGGEAIRNAAVAGLQAAGARVCDLGIVMTPTVGVATDLLSADAAVIITASHNPQEWNGIKSLIRQRSWTGAGDELVDACAPSAALSAEIIGRFRADRVCWARPQDVCDVLVDTEATEMHCQKVFEACESLLNVENYWDELARSHAVGRVVLDSVNASSAAADALFFEDTICRAVQLHGEATGLFPHAPEPTMENLSQPGGLCDAVRGLQADVGFAQDPDADRLAIVDECGRYIGEEYTLVLAAEAVLSAMGPHAEGQVLCANLSTSRMLDDVAARHGARVIRTPVGEANVVEAMKLHDAVIGGEGNGGVIWPAVTYVRDSLSAMALVLALRARTGRTISQLVASMPRYAIEKRKAPLARREDAAPAIERIAAHFRHQRVDLQDGVRVDFADRWVHVRASNTEPILRLIAEAPDRDAATKLLDEVTALVG
ncbi:MAG: phosphoglucosamine mutase [Phycisphaerales bacterium]